jgi:putative oxidoreductase
MAEPSANGTAAKAGLVQTITGWILCVPIAFAFIMAGSGKLIGRPGMVEQFHQIGIGQWFRYLTGILEVVGAIGVRGRIL